MATGSQPVLKKAPPSTGRPMPKGFYSDKEPPRIGAAPVQPPPPSTPRPWEVQPQEASILKALTPMTPGHPPRPPVEALPKPMPMESSMTNKHPAESSSQQGPPTSPSAVDMSRPGAPIPKGPPASFTPTPGDVQQESSTTPVAGPEERITDSGRYITIQSSQILIGHVLSTSNLNPISREVQGSPRRLMIYVCSPPGFPDCL